MKTEIEIDGPFAVPCLHLDLGILHPAQILQHGNCPIMLFGETWPPTVGDAALAAAGGLPAFISRIIHVSYPPGEGLYYPLDRHLTAAGHEAVANELIAAMKGLDLR